MTHDNSNVIIVIMYDYNDKLILIFYQILKGSKTLIQTENKIKQNNHPKLTQGIFSE